MNPSIIFGLLAKNGTDIEALISAVGGIANAAKLAPHIWAIVQTYQELSKQAEPTGT